LVVLSGPVLTGSFLQQNKNQFMARETITKDNAVVDALRRLKDEEGELLTRLKPVQEAIGALEKIVDKSVKKIKSSSGAKDSAVDNANTDESSGDADSDS
jgi:hypothetical protein